MTLDYKKVATLVLTIWCQLAFAADNTSAEQPQLATQNQHFIASSQRARVVQWLHTHASAVQSAAKVTRAFGYGLAHASYGNKQQLEQAHWTTDQQKLQGKQLVVGPIHPWSDVTVAALCRAHSNSATELLLTIDSLNLQQLDQVASSMAICHNRMNLSMRLMRQLVLEDKRFSKADYLAFGEYFTQIKTLSSTPVVADYNRTPMAKSLRSGWIFQRVLEYQPIN